MATNRRRRPVYRRVGAAALTQDEWRELLDGRGFFGGFEGDAERMADAWECHGERATALWMRTFPGSRPHASWLFDLVPEFGERLVLEGQDSRAWAAGADREHGILDTYFIPPIQESEQEYLRRHGLLTPEELAALAAGEVIGQFSPARLTWRELAAGWDETTDTYEGIDMAGSFGSLVLRIGATSRDLDSTLAKTEKRLQSFGRSAGRLMTQPFRAAMSAVTLPGKFARKRSHLGEQ